MRRAFSAVWPVGGTGWLGNDTALNLDAGTADNYNGLDQFGRTTKQNVLDNAGSTTRTNIEYQANRDSSPQFAEPQSATVLGKSSAYTYDGLHRLSQADTGRLNSGRTAITGEWATPQSIVYTMDILGNMTTLNRKNSAVDANETRTHNATNELTARTIAAESARYWVNDDFADNDTAQWAAADLDGDGTTSGGDDGSWSASGGKGQCDTVTTVTGAPGTGNDASVLLVDAGAMQDVLVSAGVTLNSGADGGGIVFGYVDNANYWVLLIDSGGNYRLYEVSSGTFNLRKSSTVGVSPPGTFGVSCEVRSGAVENISGMTGGYTPTSPISAGKVGLWAGSGSATIQYDNFKVLDMGMPKDIDGKWYSTAADTAITSGTLQFGTVDCERLAVRRGFRGGKYVFECDQPLGASNGNAAGVLLHYQDPENFMGVIFSKGVTNYTPKLVRRKDGDFSTIATGTAFAMTSGDRVRCAIHDDPGNSALQELKVYVNGTLRLTSTAIDDDWSAGAAGLLVRPGNSSNLTYDSAKIGLDANADDDADDAGDTKIVDDDFASTTMSLSYDDNGNLTDDGVFKYTYDAWNRLAKVKSRYDAGTTPSTTQTTFAAYAYDGLFRRISKVVTGSGYGVVHKSDDLDGDGTPDATGIQAGDRTEHYYYAGWSLIETRNGSGYTLGQWVWGTQYIDEPVAYDRNTDVSSTDSDCLDSGGSQRYTYHQDANFRVVALTNESGAVVERYDYTAYGEPTVICGVDVPSAGSESGNVLLTSGVGSPFMHQGLFRDDESGTYQNRFRQLHSRTGRFMQRDPLEYIDGMSAYAYCGGVPSTAIDPTGTQQNEDLGDGYVARVDVGRGADGRIQRDVHIYKTIGTQGRKEEVAKLSENGGYRRDHGGRPLKRPTDLPSGVRKNIRKLIKSLPVIALLLEPDPASAEEATRMIIEHGVPGGDIAIELYDLYEQEKIRRITRGVRQIHADFAKLKQMRRKTKKPKKPNECIYDVAGPASQLAYSNINGQELIVLDAIRRSQTNDASIASLCI